MEKDPSSSPQDSKQQKSVVVFPYFRDRLACDPLNFFCVYGNYEFKWDYTVEEASTSLFRLVDNMISAVDAAFRKAVEHWEALPIITKRSHALREIISHPAIHISSSFLASALRKDSSAPPGRCASAVESRSSLQSGLLSTKIHRTTGTGLGLLSRRPSFSHTTSRSSVRERREEDEEVMADLLKQWDPPLNAPRCRIILDVVASRKSLGDEPYKSRPYRLGQMVFRYVQREHSAKVMSTFVGISDSGMTLLGRDILFPYRATGASSSRRNDVLSHHGSMRVGGLSLGDCVIGGSGSTEPGFAGSSGYLGNFIANMEKALQTTIPQPRMVTVPPSNVERVDNIRLLACFPPLDEEEI
uniref:Uncharacterized protein n=1 Tax=Trypanosoma congolense (strain IL3000) TaxID=1068625 RepID=G0UK28_TRYCI|nr:conserved hypothetical protein [Trypanosoma congolense IL3000]